MIEPEAIQKIDQRIAEKQADLVKKDLFDTIDKGLSLLSPSKPEARLAGYMAQTYEFDVPVLLDPTYADRRRSGDYEPLFAEKMREAWTEQLMARQRALEIGVDPASIPQEPEPKLFWAKCFDFGSAGLGIDVYAKFASEFRKLYREKVLRPRAERVGVQE